MPARAATRHAELHRVHPILRGIRTDEPHRAIQVRHNLLHLKPRLRPMHDDKRRVARLRPPAVADPIVIRLPSPADNLDDPRPIRLRRLEHIHRQRHAIVFRVDDVLNPLHVIRMNGAESDSNKAEE